MDARESKQYERFKDEAQSLRGHVYHLEAELRALRPRAYRADGKIDRLEQRLEKVLAENALLRQRVKDLTVELKHKPKPVPAFVKANIADGKAAKKPGRRKGHTAAVRTMPVRYVARRDRVASLNARRRDDKTTIPIA